MTQQRRSTPQRGPRRLAPAAFAVRLALMTLAGAGLAIGSQPVLAQSVAVEHRIPAGPLSAALHAYAAKAGITLSFEESLTAGLRTQGLQGSYGVQQGLDRLLEGTGLDALPGNGGGWRLRRLPQPAQGEATLGTVKVTAAAERSGTTEGSGSYTARVTTTATKLALSPRETPQTVTVVTRQAMDDFGLINVDEVLKSTSGINVVTQGGDGSTYFSRGFRVQTQYDGLPNPIGISESNRIPSPDSAFFDRVEIQQGAAGLLNGAGEPGGTVNLVRKRPTKDFQAHVEAQLGSWDKKRVVGDVFGALLESGAIRGRAVAVWDKSDAFVDYAHDEKKAFYGVIEADLTASTTVAASVQYQKNEGNDHWGVLTAPDGGNLGFSRSKFFASANASLSKEYLVSTLSLEQRLPSDWVLKAAYSHNETDVDHVGASWFNGGPLNVATGDGWRLRQFLQQREFRSNQFDAYVSGPVSIFGRKHEFAFGANGSKMEDRNRLAGTVETPFNVYTSDPAGFPRITGTFAPWGNFSETRQHGVYGVARLNLADSLKLILGTRLSWYEYENARGVRTHDENRVVSPYAGIVYDLGEHYSVYASYSDIFKAQSNLERTGKPIDPVVGANYEAGVKGEFYGGRLNAAAAVFRLEQTNLAKRDDAFGNDPGNPCAGWCYVAQDKVVSQGVDLSLYGELLAGWNVGAGYTYVDAEYASGANKGKPYATTVPDHSLRLFSTYRIRDTDWVVGGSVRAQSETYASGSTWKIRQGGHALVGLMAKYKIDRNAELLLTVDNLFDRTYFSALGNPSGYTFYGEPRKFLASLKYAF